MSRRLIARLRLDYPAFQLDVDLSLPGAGITVLFGHSGSGKTTLLRCLAGLQRASSGFVEIDGRVWQDSDRDFFLPPHRRNLGYVFEDANLLPHLSVDGNLRFGLKRTHDAANDREITHILALLGIEHLLSRMPDRLSGGERQRVAIARALVLKPDVLLMDEPLAALDGKRKQEVLPFLANLNREFNIPVLYVTHAQQEVAQLADHVVIMAEGRVLAQGGLMETLNRLDLPFAQEREACSVWQVEVLAHDTDYQLTRVGCRGGELSLSQIDVSVGRPALGF